MGSGQFTAQKDCNITRSIPSRQRGLLFRQLFGNARYPLFTWASAAAMIGVFIYEIIRNHQLSGSWIQTNPLNPMIGPNYMALINMGSKFVPCMRETSQYPPTTSLNNCYATVEDTCTIEQLCGFGGFHGEMPQQSFRFFVPIFLHAGVVHILLNLIAHFQIGSGAERDLGLIRFMILYLSSGIWGFILGGVLAGTAVSSMGCSGALFGLVGYTVVDLIVNWKQIKKPGRELMKLLFVIVISLVLGLLPGLDNFAHIGGLIMGLLVSVLLKSKSQYASHRSIIITWIARIVSFILIIVLFVIFLHIFYTTTDLSNVCPGCKYLSCLPVNGWCDV
ncbi:MAG: rhomboid family-domain-containing protein [Benjaminiella poitrasii]|nr:MAG: rhomboid family-domain-containing protein [Benjaminiella poitrasii]